LPILGLILRYPFGNLLLLTLAYNCSASILFRVRDLCIILSVLISNTKLIDWAKI